MIRKAIEIRFKALQFQNVISDRIVISTDDEHAGRRHPTRHGGVKPHMRGTCTCSGLTRIGRREEARWHAHLLIT